MSDLFYKNYTSTSVLTGVDADKFTDWSHKYFQHYIQPHIAENTLDPILEIGCGYGRYTTYLTNTLGFTNVVGIDISEEQINYAKAKYGLNNVQCVDALDFLIREKKKYKTIILMDVLEHLDLEYSIKLLTEINNAMLPGGKLIIQVPNGLSPMKPIFYGDVTHVRAFSVNSMSQILRMSDFKYFSFHALPPLPVTIKSAIHWVLWKTIVNPILNLIMLLTHGSTVGGIFSSNLLTIAIR